MINYLVQRFLWFRERGFVQITQKTLVSLFPFFLFSGIIRVISLSVFSELGYINQLFSVSDWLPAFKITGQVINNLSGFPYIFRGALDVRATKINEAMKLAAAHALAGLAQEPVPTMVLRAYALEKLEFGRDYLIPKPFDPRLLCTVAPAVARAAIESGVARQPIADWDAYTEKLRNQYQSE